MEKQVLYNVLSKIGTGKESDASPSSDYLKSLETIGMVKLGWDNELTDLGRTVRDNLDSELNPW